MSNNQRRRGPPGGRGEEGRGRGGRGRGRGGTGSTEDVSVDMFADLNSPPPLKQRIANRPNVQLSHTSDDEEEAAMQKAIEESKISARAEENKRAAKERIKRLDNETAVLGAQAGADMISDDEDDETNLPTKNKPQSKRFISPNSESSQRGGNIEQDKARSNKSTSSADLASGDSRSSTRPKSTKLKDSASSERGSDSNGPTPEEWAAIMGKIGDTKPKEGPKSFAAAAGGSSTAKKSGSQISERVVAEPQPEPRQDESMELQPEMRFNPFTFQMEPIPNFTQLPPLPKPKETKLFHALTPHDFTHDSNGRPLTTPMEKARAMCKYLDEQNRKIHEYNKTVRTRPAETAVYIAKDLLGSKGRSLKGESDLCKFLDGNGGPLDDVQIEWLKEHRKYVKEREVQQAADEATKLEDEIEYRSD